MLVLNTKREIVLFIKFFQGFLVFMSSAIIFIAGKYAAIQSDTFLAGQSPSSSILDYLLKSENIALVLVVAVCVALWKYLQKMQSDLIEAKDKEIERLIKLAEKKEKKDE
jgi:tRNA G37 N-methylase TrmD